MHSLERNGSGFTFREILSCQCGNYVPIKSFYRNCSKPCFPGHQARIFLQRKNSSRLFNQCHAIMYWKTVLQAKTVFFQSIERLQKCFLFTDDPEKEKDVLSSTSGYKISIGFLGVMIFLLLVLSTILIYKLHLKRKLPASSSRSSALLMNKSSNGSANGDSEYRA